MNMKKTYIELPHFTGRNVPITEIAKAIGKEAQYIRIGLQQGVLKFGYALKLENSSEFNYYCPDKRYGRKRVILRIARTTVNETRMLENRILNEEGLTNGEYGKGAFAGEAQA